METYHFYFSFQSCQSLYILYTRMAISSQKTTEKKMELCCIWNSLSLNEFKGKCQNRGPDPLQNHFFKPYKSNLICLLHIKHGLNIVWAPDSNLGNECIRYNVINRNCWQKNKMVFLFIAANVFYGVGWGHSSTVLEEGQKMEFSNGRLVSKHSTWMVKSILLCKLFLL